MDSTTHIGPAVPASPFGRADRVRHVPWLLSGLAILAFHPVWAWFFHRLNDGTDESWGLIALVVAVFFIIGEIQKNGPLQPRLNPFAILTAGIYLAGFGLLPPLIRAAVAILFLCALFRFDRRAPGICGLLLISLPVIATAQFYAGYPLRLITAGGMDFLLSLCPLDGEITRHGTVLWWKNDPIGVDPPCSGIQMLWAGLFIHFVLAILNRHTWKSLLFLTPLAVGAIIVANILRGFFLFFKETETISLPDWTHAGIGILLFAMLAFSWSKLAARFQKSEPPTLHKSKSPRPLLIGTLLIGLSVVPVFSKTSGLPHNQTTPDGNFPESFEGEMLIPVSLNASEHQFAAKFPGQIAVFNTLSGRRIIMRHVEQATRKLHSSADCLRAAGFHLEINFSTGAPTWSHWQATHPDSGTWAVREQVTARTIKRTWSDVSNWYWAALFKPTEGPWLAITVMQPDFEL